MESYVMPIQKIRELYVKLNSNKSVGIDHQVILLYGDKA